MKLKRLAAVIGLGLLGASAAAQAYSTQWVFEDDSIDFILREIPGGGFSVITSGAPQQGDIFVGIFEFPSASAPGGDLFPPGMEMTGVSVVQLVTSNPTTTPFWTFQPYTGGMNSILALIGPGAPTVVGGNPGGGAMAAVWINNASAGDSTSITDRNLILDAANASYGVTTNCTSLTDCLKEASLGTLFQVDGMWGDNPSQYYDPDNFWRSTVLLPVSDYSTVLNSGPAVNFAYVNAGLSNLFNDVSPVLFMDQYGNECVGVNSYNPDNCFQVLVSGDIKGGRGLMNGAIGRNEVDAFKFVRVPEPATLGMLGLGLLSLGLLRRRQG